MKNQHSAMAIPLESDKKAPRRMQRVTRKPAATPWPHRRRMAVQVEPEQAGAAGIQKFWDEHAVKTGMILFWGWFAVANWSALGRLVHLG